MIIYIVNHGISTDAFKDEMKAKTHFKKVLQDAWQDCIKFSCPRGEFYDDNYMSFNECLHHRQALINGKRYELKMCLLCDADYE